MGRNKTSLDDNDFPLKVENLSIKTRRDDVVATAESSEVAHELAERLNHDEWRRHEDSWCL